MDILKPWLSPLIILAVSVLLGYIAKVVIVNRLKAFFEKTETKLDDLFIESIENHIPLWFILAGIAAAAQASPMTDKVQLLVHKLVTAGFFISITWAASRFASGAVRVYSGEFTASASTTSLTENLTRIVVIALGAMLLLSNLGISITPILTALGVGSLAVALALQDTLSNLFAGIHIVATHLIKVGDYIKLDSGHEGFVVDVGWRTTRIREGSNNYILIPNAKLSQAIIINYHMPEPELSFPVPLGVAYGSDLEKVEKIAVEVAVEVQKTVPGAVAAFEPVVRFNAFGDSAVNFNVILRASMFTDRFLMTHEFIKRAHVRFQTEGIEIPFPQRVVHLQQPKS